MSLATAEDVAARLGRPLAANETATVAFLLEAADSTIAAAADVAVDTLDADETPTMRFLAADLVCRAMANPQNLAGLREQLGQYSSSVQFRELADGAGMQLTPMERRNVRRAFGLSTFAAVTLESPYSGTALDDQPELPL